MAEAKLLRPPHIWSGSGKAAKLIEDPRAKRWSPDQIRSMKNGTYNWKTHEAE